MPFPGRSQVVADPRPPCAYLPQCHDLSFDPPDQVEFRAGGLYHQTTTRAVRAAGRWRAYSGLISDDSVKRHMASTRRRGSPWPNELWEYCRIKHSDGPTWKGIREELSRKAHEAKEQGKYAPDWKFATEMRLLIGKGPNDLQEAIPHEDTIRKRVKKLEPHQEATSEPWDNIPPALDAHLESMVKGLRSARLLESVRVESPKHSLGNDPERRRTQVMAQTERDWHDIPAVRWARQHIPRHRIWEFHRQFHEARRHYSAIMDALEDRAVEQAKVQSGLLREGENAGPAGSFSDDFWGAPLRWAVQAHFGHQGEGPVAQIEEVRQQDASTQPAYMLYWQFDTHMWPVATAFSRDALQTAQAMFQGWGKRWVEDEDVVGVVAAYSQAKTAAEELGTALSEITVDDLRLGACSACPPSPSEPTRTAEDR